MHPRVHLLHKNQNTLAVQQFMHLAEQEDPLQALMWRLSPFEGATTDMHLRCTLGTMRAGAAIIEQRTVCKYRKFVCIALCTSSLALLNQKQSQWFNFAKRAKRTRSLCLPLCHVTGLGYACPVQKNKEPTPCLLCVFGLLVAPMLCFILSTAGTFPFSELSSLDRLFVRKPPPAELVRTSHSLRGGAVVKHM